MKSLIIAAVSLTLLVLSHNTTEMGFFDFLFNNKKLENKQREQFQDSVTTQIRHKEFIKKVCDSKIVYALKNSEGFATSSSVQFEDKKGKPIGIICFWAEKARAKSCIKENWKNYKVVEVPLAAFMENWCIGMENDNLLIGTGFDENMFGYEAEPLELILELTTELKSLGKDLEFRKFKGISDLEKQVKAIIE
ncbi:DUF2750 domain-containing protein [Kordia sp.]|uniref:DUF2750 domain-containing protein n=1 Tax=Kordia sp. TaxID=1965332 RepID=UPI003B5AD28F